MPRRVAIIGAGVSGLGVAWALDRHPNRFDFRVYEAADRIGGNAVTADMPQADGSAIPFDISVTACIPSVYHHILLLMQQHGIELVDTRFSYSVRYRGGVYAHDFDSDIRRQLQPEIAKFQKLLRANETLRPAQPVAVQNDQRAQPFQLCQHGHGSQFRQVLGRLSATRSSSPCSSIS